MEDTAKGSVDKRLMNLHEIIWVDQKQSEK